MEGEWQQLIQSVFFGLVFSFLFAKLISVVISFRDENLSLTRDSTYREENLSLTPDSSSESREGAAPADDDSPGSYKSGGSEGEESLLAEKGSVCSGSLLDDEDDWEGVESTQLDEEFSAATAFVAATVADRMSQKVSADVQLRLYGLYKIATEGPCSGPQPSALKMTARAKWQAWQKLGAMLPEEAMQKYIAIVTELYPTWAAGSAKQKSKDEGESSAPSGDSKGPMGPVFSTFVYEEEGGTELKMDAIHVFAREGEVDNMLKCIDNGSSVNLKDSEGRTPLHWAVDRGHLNLTELLLKRGADVNAKDQEGQTALHYAVVCEREEIAEFLVKENADTTVKDNDGASPLELCGSKWPWLQGVAKQA